MQDRTAYNLQQIMTTLDAAVSDLTVFRDKGLFRAFADELPEGTLRRFVHAIFSGDIRVARDAISSINAELLLGDGKNLPRRISGNLLHDYLLDMVLLSDNAFSLSAASRCVDEALFSAMQHDLTILSRLRGVNEDMLYRVLNDRSRELVSRSRGSSDTASVMASAAWGGSIHHVPKDYTTQRDNSVIIPSGPVINWNYGEFALRDSYFADEALEEMYRRLLETDDWSELTDDLWNFHSSYGCGHFLKYRNFCFDGDLKPLTDLRSGDFVQLAEAEYRSLLNNAIAFMRDESSRPMLLCGDEGMGKTSIMLELTDELPKLRLVLVTGGYDKLSDLFNILKRQPLKFMVLVDDMKPAKLSGIAEPLIPPNVLLAACSETSCLQSLFEVTVSLPHPQLNEFVRIVDKLLKAQQVELSQDVIRSACVDYQVDTRCEFNIASAVRIAELLQS